MKIGVERDICYGHRLMHHPGKCSKIHGHNAKIVVELEGPPDEKSGMVTDFSHAKKAIDSVLLNYDHVTLINSEDPHLNILSTIPGVQSIKGEPTAETLAGQIYGTLIEIFEPMGIKVVSVQFFETPDNYCVVGLTDDVF